SHASPRVRRSYSAAALSSTPDPAARRTPRSHGKVPFAPSATSLPARPAPTLQRPAQAGPAKPAPRSAPESPSWLRVACWSVWAIVAIYIGVRLSLLPADASASWGFTHDSAYIGIVARNVIAGLGLVNQAHWLVFLAPDSLPMPFHNANPLYPLAVAGSALGS